MEGMNVSKKMVSFYLEEEIVRAYKERARETGKRDSEIVREALRKHLELPVETKRKHVLNREQEKGMRILRKILSVLPEEGETKTVFLDWENDLIALNSKPISFGKANVLITWVSAHLRMEGIGVEILPRKDIIDIGNGKSRVKNIGFDIIFEKEVSRKMLQDAVDRVQERLQK